MQPPRAAAGDGSLVLRRAPAERNAIMLAIVFGFSRGKEIGSFQKKRHSKKEEEKGCLKPQSAQPRVKDYIAH